MLMVRRRILPGLSMLVIGASLSGLVSPAWAQQQTAPAPAAQAPQTAAPAAPTPSAQPPQAAPLAPAAPAGEPLTLDQAVATGVKFNPRVTGSGDTLQASRALVTEAYAQNSLTANIQLTHTQVSAVPTFTLPVPAPPPQFVTFETVSFGQSQQTQAQVTVAKPLWTGGRIPAAVRQAKAGVSASREDLRRTYQTVNNDVEHAYYAVLLAEELVKVADQATAAAREHLRVAEANLAAGTAPRFDVLRAEAQVAQNEQGSIQARNGLNLARAALNNAMGVPQPRDYQLTSPLALPQPETTPLDALVKQAESARPEVGQAQAQINAFGGAVDFARSDKQPTLGVAWIYSKVINASIVQVTNWTLALQASLTIFNGKQTDAAIDHARSQQQAARALLEQVQQGIALQVRQAFLSINSARERVVAATKGVAQAEEAYRIATVRYNAGVSIGVEVLDAEAALTAARSNYAQAVYDYNAATADLEYAVGAWQPPAETPTLRMSPPMEKPKS